MQIFHRLTRVSIVLSFSLLAAAPALADADLAERHAPNAWTMEGHDPQHSYANAQETAITPANFQQMSVTAWPKYFPGDSKYPVQRKGRLFVCTNWDGFTALNARTGAIIWQRSDLDLGACMYHPAIAPGAVFVSTVDTVVDTVSVMYALRPSDGELLWKTVVTNSWGLDSVLPLGDIVVVPDNHSKVYAFDARTGAKRWVAETCAWNGPASAKDGVVVVPSWYMNQCGGTPDVVAFDQQTGSVLWRQPVGSNAGEKPVLIMGQRVIVNSGDGRLRAFDLHSGAPLWTSAISYGTPSYPLVANLDGTSLLRAAYSKTELIEIDVATGAERRRLPLPADYRLASNLVGTAKGVLFAMYDFYGSGQTQLAMLDLASGATQLHSQFMSGWAAEVTASGGRVRVSSSGGDFYSFTPASSQ